MVKLDFTGKVVIVTGASVASDAVSCGSSRSREHVYMRPTLQRPTFARFVTGDVSDPEFLKALVRDVHSKEGRIDVLVNNAGICPRTPLTSISADEWQRVLDVNLRSAFVLSQSCMEVMIPRHSGVIISLAAMGGKVGGLAVGAHYVASKAGIVGLTKSLARFGAPYNVRANAVCPGVIDTPMTSAASPEQMETYHKAIPLGRVGTVDEVVLPMLFLASDLASYITGATLDINGGALMD